MAIRVRVTTSTPGPPYSSGTSSPYRPISRTLAGEPRVVVRFQLARVRVEAGFEGNDLLPDEAPHEVYEEALLAARLKIHRVPACPRSPGARAAEPFQP